MKKEKITINFNKYLKRIIVFLFLISIFLIQLLIYIELLFNVFGIARYLIYINLFIHIFGIITVAVLYNKNVNISYKLTWIILILVFPFFGLFVYYIFSNGNTLPKKIVKVLRKNLTNKLPYNDYKDILKNNDKTTYKLLYGLQNSTGFPLYNNSKVEFFKDAFIKYEEVIKDIKNAKKYIFLEFFIVSEGELLSSLIELLKEKARNGISIYFIYDDLGSKIT